MNKWPRRKPKSEEKPGRFNFSRWYGDTQARLHATSSRARWTFALGLALVLVITGLICSSGPIALALVIARPCEALPAWANYYLFLPPTILVAGSMLVALLFGLRRSLNLLIGLLLAVTLLCALSYLAWFPLSVGSCL
jgi:uncharacterized BrkB/YihY/UPF0761 family membrane protein